jgi:hypothetical protein
MFQEQRQQPVWLLALFVLMTSTFGVAVMAATTDVAGLLVGSISTCAVIAAWWNRRSPIKVTQTHLHVGRMSLEREFIGSVEVLDAGQFRARTSFQVRADDMLSLLKANHGGVVVHNLDTSDPIHQWVIGSSRAQALAEALSK